MVPASLPQEGGEKNQDRLCCGAVSLGSLFMGLCCRKTRKGTKLECDDRLNAITELAHLWFMVPVSLPQEGEEENIKTVNTSPLMWR